MNGSLRFDLKPIQRGIKALAPQVKKSRRELAEEARRDALPRADDERLVAGVAGRGDDDDAGGHQEGAADYGHRQRLGERHARREDRKREDHHPDRSLPVHPLDACPVVSREQARGERKEGPRHAVYH